jgi:prepilin-type processing-associated H-X9-DG protein
MYTDAYNGRLMNGDYSIANGYTAWHKQLVNLEGREAAKKLTWCANDLDNLKMDPVLAFKRGRISYGFNRRHLAGVKLVKLKSPSRKLILVENAQNISTNRLSGFYHVESGISPPNPMAYPRHAGDCNVLLGDGHAESFKAPGNNWQNLYSVVFGQSWSPLETGTMWNRN